MSQDTMIRHIRDNMLMKFSSINSEFDARLISTRGIYWRGVADDGVWTIWDRYTANYHHNLRKVNDAGN